MNEQYLTVVISDSQNVKSFREIFEAMSSREDVMFVDDGGSTPVD